MRYCSYAINTAHNIDQRSWIISHPELGNNLWSSRRTLDDVNGEIVERISSGTSKLQYCEIHMPVKGWYLFITSPSKAFRTAQKQASHPHASSSGQGKSYVNLIPSRTSSSTQVGAGGNIEFKFHLVHASSSSFVPESVKKERKRRSHVVVETDSDRPNNADSLGGQKGWTRFENEQTGTTSSSSPPSPNPFPDSSHTSGSPSIPPQIRTSTFTLRPINHSIAKSHVASLDILHSSSHPGKDHHLHNKEHKRMSLRGLAGLFSATDNSFELIWENEESETHTPILIFEDHPSILRTETKGQFHLLKSLISEEFQIPTDIVGQGQQQQHQEQKQGQGQRAGEIQEEAFDPLTFFISVGIAYLGFLEDQEAGKVLAFVFVVRNAYKAASQG